MSGWQGEIETSVSSDFTVHIKPSLIAWLTELAEGLASDRVLGAEHLLWFLDRNLEAGDSEPAGSNFLSNVGSLWAKPTHRRIWAWYWGRCGRGGMGRGGEEGYSL